MIWLLWNNRNHWLWSQEERDEIQLGVQAFHMWDDWYKAQKFNNNYQMMNNNSNIFAGFHQDMIGSNVMSMSVSTMEEGLQVAAGAFVTRSDSLSVRKQTR
jgi:hypothetical protein